MIPRAQVDLREFNRVKEKILATTKKTITQETNQRLANVAHWALDHLSAVSLASQKSRIRSYMRSPRVIQRPGAEKPKTYRAVDLIMAARRKAQGKKSMSDKDLKKAASKLFAGAVAAVGYFRVVFAPIAQKLNPVVKFVVPVSLTKGIARWPKSKGYGKAVRAILNWFAKASFEVGVNINTGPGRLLNKKPGPGKKQFLNAFQNAVDKETREMKRQIEKRLMRELNAAAKR